jgi:hypothetical protein
VLLGFEPFLQAIVSLDGKMDVTQWHKEATIGKSGFLDISTYKIGGESATVVQLLPGGRNITLLTAYVMPEPMWTTALISALAKGKAATQPEAKFFCPTGNCTWEPYTSLAVCSACNNITDHLNRSTQAAYGLMGYPAMTYSLPYVNITNPDGYMESPAPDDFISYVAAATLVNPGRTISFQNLDTMISTAGVGRALA